MSDTQERLALRIEQFDAVKHDYLTQNKDALRLGLVGVLSNGITLVTAGDDLAVDLGSPFLPSLVLNGEEFLVSFGAGWTEESEAGGELKIYNADTPSITEAYAIDLVYRMDEHRRYAFVVEGALYPESQDA